MTMLKHSPFDVEGVRSFRKKLHALGGEIRSILDEYEFSNQEDLTLRTIGNKLAQCKLYDKAAGEGVIEKVTHGIEPSEHEKLTGHSGRYEELNLENKYMIMGWLSEVEGFDAQAMLDSKPQLELFTGRVAEQCAAIDRIARAIQPVFGELVIVEDGFHDKMKMFREFESVEIGRFNYSQRVDDPFDVAVKQEAAPQEGVELS